jgi:polyhydroxyalkanoate synthesis regulator phasin
MTFKEALAAKDKQVYAEYQMRAARIVNWMLEQGEIKEDESEELYLRLWSNISESDDEFDETVFYVLAEMRSEKEEERENEGKTNIKND